MMAVFYKPIVYLLRNHKMVDFVNINRLKLLKKNIFILLDVQSFGYEVIKGGMQIIKQTKIVDEEKFLLEIVVPNILPFRITERLKYVRGL